MKVRDVLRWVLRRVAEGQLGKQASCKSLHTDATATPGNPSYRCVAEGPHEVHSGYDGSCTWPNIAPGDRARALSRAGVLLPTLTDDALDAAVVFCEVAPKRLDDEAAAGTDPKPNSLKDELKSIAEQTERLEARKRAIYRDSLTAPDEHKVCEDWVAKMLGEEDPWPRFTFPIDVHGIEWSEVPVLRPPLLGRGTTWVAIRPCDGDGKRTYLGFLLGDVARGASVRYHRESGVLAVSPAMHNPAIWVPDLGRIVFGCESWWGAIKNPEGLRQITDADIHDVWYVRALRDLEKAAPPPAPAGAAS